MAPNISKLSSAEGAHANLTSAGGGTPPPAPQPSGPPLGESTEQAVETNVDQVGGRSRTSIVQNKIIQPHPHTSGEGDGGGSITDSEAQEEDQLARHLDQLYKNIAASKRQLEQLNKETRAAVIRHRTEEAEAELRSIEQSIREAEANAEAGGPRDQPPPVQPQFEQPPLMQQQQQLQQQQQQHNPHPPHPEPHLRINVLHQAGGGAVRDQPPGPRAAPRLPHYDSKSPLSYDLQTIEWPQGFALQHLPHYDGTTEPCQYLMTYEAAVSAAGGDDDTMAKAFVIVARDIAQTWYSNLRPGSIR